MGIIWNTVVSVNENNFRDYDWDYREYGINSLDQGENYGTKIRPWQRMIGIKIDFVNEFKIFIGIKIDFVNEIKVLGIIGIKIFFVNEIKVFFRVYWGSRA